MAAYRYTVIGVLIVTHSVLSHDMNCTSVTMTCPTAKQWAERGKNFSCTGKKQYICLLASNRELREGCIFNSTIPAGQIGCPNINHCDDLTGQPLIVTRHNYLPCPPEHNGCPPRNHSGYSILQIYKYPACQGRYISEESSFSADEDTTTAGTNLPLGIPNYGNWAMMIIWIAIGIFFILIFCVYLWAEDTGYHCRDLHTASLLYMYPRTRFVFSETQNDDQLENSCAQDSIKKKAKLSTKMRTFIRRFVSNRKKSHTMHSKSFKTQSPVQLPNYHTTQESSVKTIKTEHDFLLEFMDEIVPDPPADQQNYLIARQSSRLSTDLTTEPKTRDFGLGSDKQLVSVHKDSRYRKSYRRNCPSSDSDESESSILELSSNSICEQPSVHISISSSQEGPHNPCQELSYTDPMFAKGDTRENDKNMEELQRRLDASVKENNYLKTKIKYLEKISGLSVDLNADINVEGSQEGDLSTRLHM